MQLLKLSGGKVPMIRYLIFTILEPGGITLTPQSSIEHVHITEMLWICVREIPGYYYLGRSISGDFRIGNRTRIASIKYLTTHNLLLSYSLIKWNETFTVETASLNNTN
jgi:hypothetical protein